MRFTITLAFLIVPVAAPAQNKAGPAADDSKPDVKYTAEEFFKASKTESGFLINKHAGKVVELTGVVEQATLDFGGNPLLLLRGSPGGLVDFVNCPLADPNAWAKVFPGQTVTLRGRAPTSTLDPKIFVWTVKSVTGPEPPRMAAADFAKEFVADPGAAKEKYKGKYVILTGVVAEQKERNGLLEGVRLKLKDEKPALVCYTRGLGGEKEQAFHKRVAKPGQTVTVAGEFSDYYSDEISLRGPIIDPPFGKPAEAAPAKPTGNTPGKTTGKTTGTPKVKSVAPPKGVIAEAGFNDAKGIYADPVPDSPYPLGQSNKPGGDGEPGWAGPWGTERLAEYVKDVVFEGDGAVKLVGTTHFVRKLKDPVTKPFRVEQHVLIPADGGFACYLQPAGLVAETSGPIWRAHGGTFQAFDGNERGSGSWVDTKIPYKTDTWYEVTVAVDFPKKRWELWVDGKKFEHPGLHFRGQPQSIQAVNFLVETRGGAYLDLVRVLEGATPKAGDKSSPTAPRK